MDAPQGEAELKFMSVTSDGAPNLDAFGFNLDGVCRVGVDCKEEIPPTSLQGVKAVAGARLHGNMLSLTERAEVNVFDMSGSLVVRKAVLAGEVDMSSLVRTNGVYRVVVRQGREKLVATWAKVK